MIYDVVIAGGGPVGSFLACELKLAGVSVLVLERMEDPHSPLKAGWMGMRGLNFPSVEAFYRRGMLEDVRANALGWMNVGQDPGMELRGAAATNSAPAPRFAGHFAGMMLDVTKIDFSNRKYAMAGPSASGGMVSLEAIEFLLAERATELGVDLRRGMAVTNFTEDEHGVTVSAGDESFQARWLVGCDGGRSAVRKLAAFEFAGTEPEFTGYTAAVKIADPEKLRPGFNLTETGLYLLGPGPDRIGIVDFDDASFDRTQTPTLESLQEVLRRVSGTDVTLTSMDVASTYTDRARQATTYRKGRVLLAGDAAHVHSPLGGQGLNTGLGDAMNLGWKLAATIQGWAPAGLLDTYTEERHPIGAWALNWTRAQVAIMRPDPHARAIASVIRDLIQTRDATTYFVEKISGIVDALQPARRSSTDWLQRTRLRVCRRHKARRTSAQRQGIAPRPHRRQEAPKPRSTLANRLNYVSAQVKDSKGLTAMFVRPDGFVAWVTESDPDPHAAEQSIKRWLGNAT